MPRPGPAPSSTIGPLRAHLLGYVRLRRFEHRIDGEVAFDTRQVFLICVSARNFSAASAC